MSGGQVCCFCGDVDVYEAPTGALLCGRCGRRQEEVAAIAAMLERGMFVENVHPCNRGRYPVGLVEGVDAGLGLVSVRLGRGSTCFGPAENWRQTSARPDWLEEVSAIA